MLKTVNSLLVMSLNGLVHVKEHDVAHLTGISGQFLFVGPYPSTTEFNPIAGAYNHE